MRKFFNNFKKSCKRFMTGKSGFSLVELIVVIAIMAVIAAVLAPALLGYVERSRAQKDDSAMGEVTNAIQLSLADQNVYDEMLQYTVKGNFSCYADGDISTNVNTNKVSIKEPSYWLYNDNARLLDETAYVPAGSMRGVTVTLKPNGSAEYILKDGIVNQIGDDSTKKGDNAGAVLANCPELHNRLRSTVGDTIKVSSQTYRNSTYTIFISMGTTGGNEAAMQDAIKVWGQYNGTNLPEVMTATGSGSQTGGAGGSEQPDGGGAPTLDLSTVNTDLSTNTWADVQKVSQAGMVADAGWSIGATKTLTIDMDLDRDGTFEQGTAIATLIGINHDGVGTTTWQVTSKPYGIGKHIMNSNGRNDGGWKESEMREWLNTDILESMIDTKDYIKEVPKNTNNIGHSGNVTSITNDKIFLLSPKEAGYAPPPQYSAYSINYDDMFNSEGTTYELYKERYTNGSSWFRSPYVYSSGFFVANGDALLVGGPNQYNVYVNPAFVIG